MYSLIRSYFRDYIRIQLRKQRSFEMRKKIEIKSIVNNRNQIVFEKKEKLDMKFNQQLENSNRSDRPLHKKKGKDIQNEMKSFYDTTD